MLVSGKRRIVEQWYFYSFRQFWGGDSRQSSQNTLIQPGVPVISSIKKNWQCIDVDPSFTYNSYSCIIYVLFSCETSSFDTAIVACGAHKLYDHYWKLYSLLNILISDMTLIFAMPFPERDVSENLNQLKHENKWDLAVLALAVKGIR